MSYFGPSGFWNLIDDIKELASDAAEAIEDGCETFVEGCQSFVDGLTDEKAPSSDFGDLPREKAKRTKLRKKMIKKTVLTQRRKLCLACENSLSSQQDKIGNALVEFDGDSVVKIKYVDMDRMLKALSKASALLKGTQAKSIKTETFTVSLPSLPIVAKEVAKEALATHGDYSGINPEDYYDADDDDFIKKLKKTNK